MVCSRQSGGLCQATLKPWLRHPKHSSHLEGNSSFLFTQALTLGTAFTHWYSHSPRTTGQDVLSTLLSNYFPESNFFSLPWELPSCLTLPSSLAWLVMEHLQGSSHGRLMLLVLGPTLGSEAPECVSNWRKNERSGKTRRRRVALAGNDRIQKHLHAAYERRHWGQTKQVKSPASQPPLLPPLPL